MSLVDKAIRESKIGCAISHIPKAPSLAILIKATKLSFLITITVTRQEQNSQLMHLIGLDNKLAIRAVRAR